ncbi:S9 family peptidase [Rhizobium tumorigenes]|uniref:S9 family peptidase n=1 Tax=Rhizobium tumorigenes TaxID=2041385 RepID=UPI00241DA0E4|nr:S9 family peptidase [Rhizobium tumorigenes]WFS03569.1 S9 family peptidase [Rhizobium tumorigenes]
MKLVFPLTASLLTAVTPSPKEVDIQALRLRSPIAPTTNTAEFGSPISPSDIMQLHDMRHLEMSPDGKTILFVVQRQVATFGSDQQRIWFVPTDGSEPARELVSGPGVDNTPRWSPDGGMIAFLSNRSSKQTIETDMSTAGKPAASSRPEGQTDGSPPAVLDAGGKQTRQLWKVGRNGGEPVPLPAVPCDITDFAWSPEGTKIAFLSADPDPPGEKADREAKRDWVEMGKAGHMSRLWVLDLLSHKARPVSPETVNVSKMAWSPDGKRMAVRVADTSAINDHFYHSRITTFDLQNGTLGKTLIEHAAEGPLWAPDGTAILASEILTPGFIGMAPRVYSFATNTLIKLADDHAGLLTRLQWAADSRSILALSFEETQSRLVRIAATGNGRVTRLATLEGEAFDLTTSQDDRLVAVALSSPERPADVWTIAGKQIRPITMINPQVARWKCGKVSQISWTSSHDGKRIYSVLVTPPDYTPGNPIKTVIQIHGGPEWAWWAGWLGSWHEWAQMLATHGYAVLLPNPRGSDGQGTAFARAIGHDWGGVDYQDVIDGVDMLVAMKISDPSRLGIGGWSYGGFMAAWAVTHSERFKAAVVGAAPTNMTTMARITDTPDYTMGYFGEPSAHLADLDRVSPVRMLGNVHTPVLVLHGEADTRVPIALGLEFYRALRLLGKPVKMISYPREAHWFSEPEHQADIQRRVLDWFDAYL